MNEAPATPVSCPRAPSPWLIVDANIILSAILGRRSLPVFHAIAGLRSVATSVRAVEEVRGVLHSVPDLPADVQARADRLLGTVAVIDAPRYKDLLDEAADILRHAVASRNGSTADAHVLACAWLLDADIWSHDRDFAGIGWPSWSNANLRRSLDAR